MKETKDQREARQGGEREAQAGLEYHRQMARKQAAPAKRAIGRKLKR
jgi:hypothetical protein